jgi:hypothetical protein
MSITFTQPLIRVQSLRNYKADILSYRMVYNLLSFPGKSFFKHNGKLPISLLMLSNPYQLSVIQGGLLSELVLDQKLTILAELELFG